MEFLEHEIEEILNIFREESDEQLQKINKNLLKLEVNPKDASAIAELFREAHSLKGAARMIGLEGIQSIAHKLEDVFGQAKEQYIAVTPEIVDILCKAVDCMGSIVSESIRTRGKAEFPEVQKVISSLENITNTENTVINIGHDDDYDPLQLSKESSEKQSIINEEIKKLLTQIRIKIENLKIYSVNPSILKDFLFLINELDRILEPVDNTRIKGLVFDIKFKVESAIKGSGILIDKEISEIEDTYDTFISLYERLTYNIIEFSDYSNVNFSSITKDIPENVQPAEHPLSPQEDAVLFIKNNISLFSEHTENNIAKFDEVISALYQLITTVNNDKIREIIEKIANLLLFSKENFVPLNSDIVKVLEESFTAVVQLLEPTGETKEDPELILQRVMVLQQILKFSAKSPSGHIKKLDKKDEPSAKPDVPTVSYSPVKKNTNIFPVNKPMENENFGQFDIKFGESSTIKTLRVDTQKLDQLVNEVGELIIAKIKAKEHLFDIARIVRSIEEWYREWNKTRQYFRHIERHHKSSDKAFSITNYSAGKNMNIFFEENSAKLLTLMNKMNSLYKIIHEDDARMNLIVSGLEEKIKSVRVLPLATIFHLFPRMVRDIAREKNKEIDFVITGSETSVDKKIIEEIKSPIMHIIRNAIDHGIESPEERAKNGKDPVGKILLAAYHLENSVLIEITDDGKGIDIANIKRKVLQKGLLTSEELEAMSEEQIVNIIFWPGFSTGETVTDISGRGIGLDIVYTKISQLNGKVKVKSSFGKGSQVSIQLPVTMATIKSFLVEVGGQTFAIPTSSIKTTLLVNKENILYKEGKKTIIVEDRTVHITSLAKVLEMEGAPVKKSGKLVIIVVQAEDVQVGFIVDRLAGDQEILHKNLSPPLLKVRNIAGITTLGSGDLCLILNVSDLVKSAYLNFGRMGNKPLLSIPKEFEHKEKKVLVVDDTATTRILQRNILKSAGYIVNVAINGFDALAKILSEDYDAVITDVEMPEINGFELTERLRQHEKYKTIPIVLVTSLSSDQDKVRGMTAGASAYITKGEFNQEELLNTLQKLMK